MVTTTFRKGACEGRPVRERTAQKYFHKKNSEHANKASRNIDNTSDVKQKAEREWNNEKNVGGFRRLIS